mmetsp:Transcript_96465/g.241926  ORF Transcript_96465/g.241926 Transcript_96465/m.241926 type:complete len:477 (+) Transcript_96465:78-1508(+)
MIGFAGPVDAGQVVHVGMLHGQTQLEEARRLADLQARSLGDKEKADIRKRRAASVERYRAASAQADRRAKAGGELQAALARRRACSRGSESESAATSASESRQSESSDNAASVLERAFAVRRSSAFASNPAAAATEASAVAAAPKVESQLVATAPVASAPRAATMARSVGSGRSGPVKVIAPGGELQAALARRRAAIRSTGDDASCGSARSSGSSTTAPGKDPHMDASAGELQAALARRRMLAGSTADDAATPESNSSCRRASAADSIGAAGAHGIETRGKRLASVQLPAASASGVAQPMVLVSKEELDNHTGSPIVADAVCKVASPCRFGGGSCLPAQVVFQSSLASGVSDVGVVEACPPYIADHETRLAQGPDICFPNLSEDQALKPVELRAPLEDAVCSHATDAHSVEAKLESHHSLAATVNQAIASVSVAEVVLAVSPEEVSPAKASCREMPYDEQSSHQQLGGQPKCCALL